MPELILTTERFAPTKRQVDRANGIIRDVKVIGFESKNGRLYTPDALRKAVSKYEGAKVNIDHPPANDPLRPRSVADRIGTLRNVRFVEASGLHADFHFNPKHPLAEQVAWAAEHDPTSIGFSHNAMVKQGRRQDGKQFIEDIDRVVSVDLVADPATTNGVFESAWDAGPETPVGERTTEEWLAKLTGGKTAVEEQVEEQSRKSWFERITSRR